MTNPINGMTNQMVTKIPKPHYSETRIDRLIALKKGGRLENVLKEPPQTQSVDFFGKQNPMSAEELQDFNTRIAAKYTQEGGNRTIAMA